MTRLVVPLVLALLAACAPAADDRPDVVFVTLDTVVPARLGCYGGDVPTPTIDELARTGILFTEARSVAPITLPAHASMLTGLVPPRHGVRVNGVTRLADEAETLAERLAAEGWATAAFVAAQVLDARYGLDQGFETFEGAATGRDDSFALGEVPATAVVDRALRWWRARPDDRPAFLWVHLFDPHMPHAAPAEHVARAGGDAYGGEIAYADAELGRLLAEVPEDALVVFVGDHGEAFGAHGEDTHGSFVYDATMRVPLVLRLPAAARAGERVAATTSVTDVFPTVLSVLGLPPREGLDGVDLTAAVAPGRGVYLESYYGYTAFGWSPMAAWYQEGWKLVQAPRAELYHVAADLAEATNLADSDGERAEAMRASLRAVFEAPALPLAPVAATPEQEALLAKLGYAGGGVDLALPSYPTAFERQELPAPHTRARQLQAFGQASVLYEQGQPEIAMSKLREILTDNSRNHSAQQLAGLCLMQFRQWAPAAQAFQSAMRYREGPWAGGWLNLAICLDNLGRRDEALGAFLRAHALSPLPAAVVPRVRTLLDQAGRGDEAARLFGGL